MNLKYTVTLLSAAATFLSGSVVAAQEQSSVVGGVGVDIAQLLDSSKTGGRGALVVMKVRPGFPAEKAGIAKGDIICKVNGVALDGLSLMEAATKIRGSVGEPVELTLQEENGQEFSQEMVRVELPELATCEK